MPKKRFSAEQIVVLLRQIEVLMSQGKSAPIACRESGISQQTSRRMSVVRLFETDPVFREGRLWLIRG